MMLELLYGIWWKGPDLYLAPGPDPPLEKILGYFALKWIKWAQWGGEMFDLWDWLQESGNEWEHKSK